MSIEQDNHSDLESTVLVPFKAHSLSQHLGILPVVYQAMNFYLYKKYISCMEIENSKRGDRGRKC